MERSEKISEPLQTVEIPVEWQDAGALPTLFANNLLIQFSRQEFYICFYDLMPPQVLGETREERIERVKELKSVVARPVAKIVTTAGGMESFLEAFQDAFGKFQQIKNAESQSHESAAKTKSDDPSSTQVAS